MTLDSVTLLLLIALQLARIIAVPPAVVTGLVALTSVRMLFAYHPRRLARAVAAEQDCIRADGTRIFNPALR